MIKVVYIISDIDKALAFEWIAEHLDRSQFVLSFLILNPGPSALETYLRERNIPVQTILCREKKDWPSALFKTYQYLFREKPQIVHCHLIKANIIGLVAAKLGGIKKRIYTRHHSSLHHIYFKKGVWWDKLSNSLATHIIAISAIVKTILIQWERVPEKKVHLIPHGFLLDGFGSVTEERVSFFKNRWNLQEGNTVIGVISRWTESKGIQFIIPAFKKFLQINPDAVLLLLNARGDYEPIIHDLLKTLPANNYRVISFENDIAAAYHAMKVFIHVPIDAHSEAFGQTYVEALAAGVPSIFTLSGIANDFIIDEENALVVPFKNSEAIYFALEKLSNDKDLARQLASSGKASVQDKFALQKMINALEKLYEQ